MVKTSPSDAEGTGLIPGQGTKIPHALWPRNKQTKSPIKQRPFHKKFNNDFKNGPHQKKSFKMGFARDAH